MIDPGAEPGLLPKLTHVSARDEIDTPLEGGESPVWDDELQALYFVDMHAPALLRLHPATARLERWPMPSTIGSCGLCSDGRVLVALRTGLHYFCTRTGLLDLLAHPERGSPENRLNDGKVSPDGRFWIGSMNESTPRRPLASLYRVDPDGTCTTVLDGLLTSNGLAWSPDGLRLYHSDSRDQYVQVADYDPATGSIANWRRICDLSLAEGRPDGAAMDREGFYWSAGVSAGCLNRIGPDGVIAERIALPVAAPSMPCFGGDDLRTVYVTSLRSDGANPEAGRLISFRSDVAGVPVGRFGG